MPLEVADAWAEVYIDVAGKIGDGDRERGRHAKTVEPDPALHGST